MTQYVILVVDLMFMAYLVMKIKNFEKKLKDISVALASQKTSTQEEKDYESDLNSRLDMIQRMRFSPLKVNLERK